MNGFLFTMSERITEKKNVGTTGQIICSVILI